jgi:hypothetical protein
MDGLPLLLEIMTKVEAAGCMPEPFPANNKEEIHGTTVIRWISGVKGSLPRMHDLYVYEI